MGALLAYVGRGTLNFLHYTGGIARLGKDAAYWTLWAPLCGKGIKGRAAIHQMVLTGVSAVPIVSLISFFVGLVLAIQTAYELRKYGGTVYVVNLVAVAMSRQLGPLMTPPCMFPNGVKSPSCTRISAVRRPGSKPVRRTPRNSGRPVSFSLMLRKVAAIFSS